MTLRAGELKACMAVLSTVLVATRSGARENVLPPEQIADLMDAVHYIPLMAVRDECSLGWLRRELAHYDRKWCTARTANAPGGRSLVAVLDEALAAHCPAPAAAA